MRYLQKPDGVVVSFGTGDHEDRMFEHFKADGAVDVQIAAADDLVIRRDELPKAVPNGDVLDIGSMTYFPDEEMARTEMRAWAAVLVHLREHPPVDEEQVKALADLMTEIDPNPHGWYTPDKSMLREMVQRGVRVATSDG